MPDLEPSERAERIPFPGLPGISVDLTTSNNIYSFGVGPEIHLATGGIRPYLQGAIGLSNFATSTSAEGSDNTDPTGGPAISGREASKRLPGAG